MKKNILSVLTGMMVLCLNCFAIAADYVYKPYNNDLGDLDHYYAYSWRIDTSNIAANEKITGASLFFDNISNWDNTANILHVSLLNASVPTGINGITAVNDGDTPLTDNYFAGKYNSTLLFEFSNINTTIRDININLNNAPYKDYLPDGVSDGGQLYIPANGLNNLITYASSGIFGLGFDPDCHFYNSGITLTLHTEKTNNAVPEPATLMLFGAGLLGLAAKMRKKSQVNG